VVRNEHLACPRLCLNHRVKFEEHIRYIRCNPGTCMKCSETAARVLRYVPFTVMHLHLKEFESNSTRPAAELMRSSIVGIAPLLWLPNVSVQSARCNLLPFYGSSVPP
jgi:hypothetical protein